MKRAMSYFNWLSKFKPVERQQTENGHELFYETYGAELQTVKDQHAKHPNTVWTLTDCDNGKTYLCPGMSFVNRIAYVITQVEWTEEDRLVLW